MMFRNIPIGNRVIYRERLGTATETDEIREVVWERVETGNHPYPKNWIGCRILRLTQGIPGYFPRIDTGWIENPSLTYVNGSYPVLPIEEYSWINFIGEETPEQKRIRIRRQALEKLTREEREILGV